MKLLALISGGKDGIYSILCARRQGHEVVLLGHMKPPDPSTHELDSYMFQSVGHNVTGAIAEALGIPLIERPITSTTTDTHHALGLPVSTESLQYSQNDNDEVEDLYGLVKEALVGRGRQGQSVNSGIEGVLTGAVCSRYQLERVKNVCSRLGLKSVNPLWERSQRKLLGDMITDKMEAIIVKTCCLGLNESHLGKTISELYDEFVEMVGKRQICKEERFGFNVCGEGGEYETLVLDCPIYNKKIVVEEHTKIYHSKDPYAPTILYVPTKWALVPKD